LDLQIYAILEVTCCCIGGFKTRVHFYAKLLAVTRNYFNFNFTW